MTFEEWKTEIENFSLRVERFEAELNLKNDKQLSACLNKWLEAAWQAAIEEAAKVCEDHKVKLLHLVESRDEEMWCKGFNVHADEAANKIRKLK